MNLVNNFQNYLEKIFNMKYINFKKTKISKLGLGTVQFGLDYGIANEHGKPTVEESMKIINFAYNKGINCFDTSTNYGNAQEVLGKSLINKSDTFILSKIKSNIFINNLENSFDSILKELEINKLNVLFLHDCELLNSWDKSYSYKISKLKNSNKLDYFGVSIYTDEEFDYAIKNNDIEVIQVPFNIFDQRAINNGWIKKAEDSGKLLIIRSVFLQGLFFMNQKKIPKNLEIAIPHIKLLEEYSSQLNVKKSELALNYVDSLLENSPILFGCNSLNRAKETIETFESLKKIDKTILENLRIEFSDISDKIYDPRKWV